MSNGKRRTRRGQHRNPVRPRSTTVRFNDPNPPGDRYNLAFYAEYSQREVLLREVDRRFFQFYHRDLPRMLESDMPWANGSSRKTPSSRTTCKCDLIQQVESLTDLTGKLYRFISDLMRPRKKIGTIFISAHGSAQSVSLPIARDAPSVSVEELGRGLSEMPGISRQAPRGFTQNRWNQLYDSLRALDANLVMLGRLMDVCFDEYSMIRFWVCNLGQSRNAMEKFGRILVPSSPMILEAPRVRSIASFVSFTGNPPGSYVWSTLHPQRVRLRKLHPDVVSEVESNESGQQFTGSDLRDAHNCFGAGIKIPGAPPSQATGSASGWVPIFGLEHESSGNVIQQGNWSRYIDRWERITLS